MLSAANKIISHTKAWHATKLNNVDQMIWHFIVQSKADILSRFDTWFKYIETVVVTSPTNLISHHRIYFR